MLCIAYSNPLLSRTHAAAFPVPFLRCHTCVAAVTHRPAAAAHDGAALRVAERRKRAAYPELNGGPQQLVVLGSEVGGRWNAGAHQLLRDLVRVRAQRAPPAVRSAASSAWARRWWAMLAVSVQQAVTSTALGSAWPAPLHASRQSAPELERVLDLADAAGPSRLPLRGP